MMQRDRFWDLGASFLIAMVVALTIYRHDIFPIFMDVYYHLSVVTMFEQAGGITTVDFLQFAPMGRPHLYPPFYHIVLSFLHFMGISMQSLAQFSSAATYPITISTLYLITSRVYSKMAGFFAITLFISPWILFKETAYFPTSMIAIVLCLMAYLALFRKNYISATAFMILALYTHMSIPHFFIIPFVFLALFDRNERRNILISVAVAYAAFTPFAWQLISNFNYVNVWHVTFSNNVDIISVAFSLIGTLVLLHKVIKSKMGSMVLYPLIVIAMLCMIYPFYGHRFWYHVQIPLAIIASIGIEYLLLKIHDRYPRKKSYATFVSVLLLMVLVVTYTPLYIYYPGSDGMDNTVPVSSDTQESEKMSFESGINLYPSLFNTLAKGDLLVGSSYNYGVKLFRIAEIIISTTSEDDIILTNNGSMGCYLTAMTGRASTSGMFKEIEPYQNSSATLPVTKAYILFFIPDEPVEDVAMYVVNDKSLMIRDTDEVGKVTIPSPIISLLETWILTGLLLVLASTIFIRKEQD